MRRSVERATYRGYRLIVTDYVILVSTRDGRPVGDASAMSSARRLVREHRRKARTSA